MTHLKELHISPSAMQDNMTADHRHLFDTIPVFELR